MMESSSIMVIPLDGAPIEDDREKIGASRAGSQHNCVSGVEVAVVSPNPPNPTSNDCVASPTTIEESEDRLGSTLSVVDRDGVACPSTSQTDLPTGAACPSTTNGIKNSDSLNGVACPSTTNSVKPDSSIGAACPSTTNGEQTDLHNGVACPSTRKCGTTDPSNGAACPSTTNGETDMHNGAACPSTRKCNNLTSEAPLPTEYSKVGATQSASLANRAVTQKGDEDYLSLLEVSEVELEEICERSLSIIDKSRLILVKREEMRCCIKDLTGIIRRQQSTIARLFGSLQERRRTETAKPPPPPTPKPKTYADAASARTPKATPKKAAPKAQVRQSSDQRPPISREKPASTPPPAPEVDSEAPWTEVSSKKKKRPEGEKKKRRKAAKKAMEGQKSHSNAKTGALPKASAKVPRKQVHLLVVRPKDSTATSAVTMSAVQRQVDPSKSGICLEGIREARKGGILITAKTEEDLRSLKTEMEKATSLAEGYTFSTPAKRPPQIILFGVNKDKKATELVEALKGQNPVLEGATISCSSSFANREGMTNWVITLEPSTFKKLSGIRTLYVGWQRVSFKEYKRATICYKCAKYGHIAKFCRSSPRCGRCGSTEHAKKECDQEERCPNCTYQNDRFKGKAPTNHEAGSKECPSYQRELVKFCGRIDYG